MSEAHSASIVKAKRKRNRRKKSKTASNAIDGVSNVNGSSTTSTAASTFEGSEDSESSTQGAIDDAEAMLMEPPLRPISNQDILRKSLVLKGFSLDEIDEAVIEMWDKELHYDEYDAVLAYLERSDGGVEVMANAFKDEAMKYEGEETEDSTNNEHSTEDTIDGEELDIVLGQQRGGDEIDDSDSEGEAEPATPAMTMSEKLDLVAGFESLTDSIFALSQWINKAAKSHEVSYRRD
jgi:hypothetical protein